MAEIYSSEKGAGGHRSRTGYYGRGEMGGYELDWNVQPSQFKTYFGVKQLSISTDVALPSEPLSQIVKREPTRLAEAGLGMEDLGQILQIGYGVTEQRNYGGSDLFMRTAPSAGALYPAEVYAAVRSVDGLEDGLYHYSAYGPVLNLIRSGDLLPSLGQDEDAARLWLSFLVTSIFYRSAWKYQDRAYRYCLLDSGHVIENLALACRAARLPVRVGYDFDDGRLAQILNIDPDREGCLATVSLYAKKDLAGGQAPGTFDTDRRLLLASQVSPADGNARIVRAEHDETRLGQRGWAPPDTPPDLGLPAAVDHSLPSAETLATAETMTFAEAVTYRRSSRNFVRGTLSLAELTTLLAMVRPAPDEPYANCIRTGFIVQGAEGLGDGFYLLDHRHGTFGMVRRGSFLEPMASVCLDQRWLGNASVQVLFLSDLDFLDGYFGSRGYRYAMLEAGRLGQRVCLAATAMGLGSCPIGAFYDFDARNLLGLAENSRLLYLVAAGRTAGRSRQDLGRPEDDLGHGPAGGTVK